MSMDEASVEAATLFWLADLGYSVLHGTTIAPGEAQAERASYGDVVLAARLRAALVRLNPALPIAALEEAFHQVIRAASPSLFEHNRLFHQMLVEGVNVVYRRADGTQGGAQVTLVDFTQPAHNDWLAVNQFTIIEGKRNRRPDVVVFLNGLPLAVIELKNPADENATIKAAFNQFQTYKQDIPSLFPYNELLVISDGLEARVGTLTSEWERFMPWRTIDGQRDCPQRCCRTGGAAQGYLRSAPLPGFTQALHRL